MDAPLETDRLTLRTVRPDDVDSLLAIYGDPGVVRYLLHEAWTPEVAAEQVAYQAGRTGLDTDARALCVVVEHGGEVVGDMSLWLVDDTDRKAEIGWALAPTATGRGFGGEAAAALLRFGVERHGLHRVEARMDARNRASARLCDRLGMRREAHLRRDRWSKGEWTDTLVYGLLADNGPPPTVVSVVPDLGVGRLADAVGFWRDLFGLDEENLGLDWVTRLVAPGAQVQLVTRDATAPETPVLTVKVRDVDAVHARARRLGADIVHPLTTEPWGVRRFFVRAPGGHVLNVARYRD